MKKKYSVPKIRLILIKGRKKVCLHPSYRKTQNFIKNKAELLLKNGYLINITAVYGKGTDNYGKQTVFKNSGSYNTFEDLNWAFGAFVKEYMK